MIRAILFDCFGVIITDALEAMLQRVEVGNPELRREVMEVVHAYNLGLLERDESNGQIAAILGITVPEYRQQIADGEAKNPQVTAWIKELRKTYKTGLLSNIGRNSMQRRFTEAELQDLFDVVVISGDVGIAKPDTAIYEYAARELGVEAEECVFLDDREGHCRGAEAAGMRAILYQNFDQAKRDLEKILEKSC